MKQILIIDESPPFRDFLRNKLAENDEIEVAVAVNVLDGMAKMRDLVPDLLIMDYHLSRNGCFELLNSKKSNPNTVKMPVIIMARQIDQKKVLELVPYDVKKVFTKPVQIDALFVTLSKLLGVSFVVDESPCIVEVHVNDNIIFIEIAQGLNPDKLDLLRFKIIELIGLHNIRIPRVIVMMSDIHLSDADAFNLEKLLYVVRKASGARPRHIRILTRDDFARKFIEDQKEYEEIEVVSNLQYAIDGLLADLDVRMEYGEKKEEIIGDTILAAGRSGTGGAMQLRFETESRQKRSGSESAKPPPPGA
jgi:CheY-like chemotaxis protein